jgi:SH3-like domain-containing protein
VIKDVDGTASLSQAKELASDHYLMGSFCDVVAELESYRRSRGCSSPNSFFKQRCINGKASITVVKRKAMYVYLRQGRNQLAHLQSQLGRETS